MSKVLSTAFARYIALLGGSHHPWDLLRMRLPFSVTRTSADVLFGSFGGVLKSVRSFTALGTLLQHFRRSPL